MSETVSQKIKFQGLAKVFIKKNIITEKQAELIYENMKESEKSFLLQAISDNIISGKEAAKQIEKIFNLKYLNLNSITLDNNIVDLVDRKLIQKNQILPLYLNETKSKLYIALADPTALQSIDEIKFSSQKNVENIVVEADKLENLIDKHFRGNVQAQMEEFSEQDSEITFSNENNEPEVTEVKENDAPVVKFINKIMLDAVKNGASDIHFEPYENVYRVRLRQDGVLREVARPPHNLGVRMSARLKVLARLDLAERRVPQDGRIKINLSTKKSIDFRVSTCPTLYGEKVVMRILDPNSAKMGIDALGYSPEQKKRFIDSIHKPYGMVLVTGPTGSGKTVSLYTALNILNTEDRNISTAEDPAEINLNGVNQVNVNPKVGLTFASTLRAFLRQDPDVIMVGEIRDLETAEIAIKASQTGHMVLSTLHTNDAPQTVTRLMNMGIPSYNIVSSISIIIAQRLARKLCPSCKQQIDIPETELLKEGFKEEEIQDIVIYEANPEGCDACNGGYKGRVGIYQVMPITDEISQIVMNEGTSIDIEKQAQKECIKDLRQSGLEKVKQGVVSLTEINRIIVE